MSYVAPPLAPDTLENLKAQVIAIQIKIALHKAYGKNYTPDAKQKFIDDPSSVCSDPFGKTREESLSEDWERNKEAYERYSVKLQETYDNMQTVYEGEKKFYDTHTFLGDGYYDAQHTLKRVIHEEDLPKIGTTGPVLKILVAEPAKAPAKAEVVTVKSCWCFY